MDIDTETRMQTATDMDTGTCAPHTDTGTNRDSHRLLRKYIRRHKHGTKADTNTWTQTTDTPQTHLQPFGIN